MPPGLLLDFGGVLTTSVLESFAAFARAEGSTPEALAAAVKGITAGGDELFALVERGRIDVAAFERRLAAALSERLGVAIAPEGLKARMFAGAGPDEAMIEAVRAARSAGVATGLVSNSWGLPETGSGSYPREMFPELFDCVVISGEVGVRKPEPEIYLLAAERLGLRADACVFVDDFQVNVDGAIAVGMRGLHHRSTPATVRVLEELLGVELVQTLPG